MDDLRRLLEYNRWANMRILDAAEPLTEAELKREIPSSFQSVLATLVHAMGAEWLWLERWKGTSPTALPSADALGSVAAVRARWDELWAEQQAFLTGLGAGDRERAVSYRLLSGDADTRPLGELVRHVVNHATYHRGQLVTMLRQLGRTPPSTDYVQWLREAG
jgi:uncharacterized damage-inducible protein DinB